MPDAPSSGLEDAEPLTTLHVRGALRGEDTSLAWLVGRFTPPLLMQARARLAGPLARALEPEDLVQDVWVRALPRLTDLAPRGGRFTPVLLRFLSSVLLNRVNTLLQKHLRSAAGIDRTPAAELVEEPPSDVTRAVTAVLRRERHEALWSALGALSEEDRQLVVLRGVEQNPLPEVSLLLGLEPNTVSQRYRRALLRLRELLPGSVFDDLDEPPPT